MRRFRGVAVTHPSFTEALRFWLKLGFISFGGPAGQIAVMHAELVERKRWVGEKRFLYALNYCMLLPGPEATQLAIYCGWLLHRTWGGIVAGVLFVLPAAVLLWLLSVVYVLFGNAPWLVALFYGLKPAVTAIVVAAVIRIGRRALVHWLAWLLAGLAFIGIFGPHLPFPAIVLGAALVGAIAQPLGIDFGARATHDAGPEAVISDEGAALTHTLPSWRRAMRVLLTCAALWALPLAAAAVWLGGDSVLVREGIFFSKAAMVTFGGAYAVLPYVGQQAVEHYAWLTAPQMLDGLGLAETTPGPLIMVVQFVGFLGGWNHSGPLSPLVSATLAAAMTTWTTFVPCFLWILLGGPHLEQVRHDRRLNAALAAVTAAVVGVILNLAVWFGLHVFFPGGLARGGVDPFALALGAAAFWVLQRWNWSVVAVVLASGAVGLLRETLIFVLLR